MTEREVQHDPQVLEGEDERRASRRRRSIPTRPSPARPGRGRAFSVMRLAWIVIAIVVAIVI